MVKILIIPIIILLSVLINSSINKENTKEIKKIERVKKDSNIVDIKSLPFSLENLNYVLEKYNVKHKNIVISQYILETGNGTSYGFKIRNNLFGFFL
jgi:uncharacterized FlgJ-related protein